MPGRKRQKSKGLFGGLFDDLVVKAADFSKPEVKGAWCECKQLPKHRGHYGMFGGPVRSEAERKRVWKEDKLLPYR